MCFLFEQMSVYNVEKNELKCISLLKNYFYLNNTINHFRKYV